MTEIECAEWDIRMRDPQYRLAVLTLLLMGAKWRREEALREHRIRMKRLKAEGGYETWLKAKMERNKRYPRKPRQPAPPKPKVATVRERLKTEPEFAKAYYARKRAMKMERLEKLKAEDPEAWAAKTAAMRESAKRAVVKHYASHRDGERARSREAYQERMSDPVEGQANREKHRTKVLKAAKKRADNGKWREYMRNKRQTDYSFRIADNLRRRLNECLHGKRKPGSVRNFLGCTMDEFRAHLESKFQPGMTWPLYGYGVGKWHIDHVRPLASFPDNEIDRAFSFENLVPAWGVDNQSKGSLHEGKRWRYSDHDTPLSPCPPPSPA